MSLSHYKINIYELILLFSSFFYIYCHFTFTISIFYIPFFLVILSPSIRAHIHLFVLFLSSLILFVNGQFEYFQMVQQWPLATCTGASCLNPPSNKFTIHGLWPSNFSNAILVCKGSTFNSTNTVPYTTI